jgi:hypothetical protein
MESGERHYAADIKYDLRKIEIAICNDCAGVLKGEVPS